MRHLGIALFCMLSACNYENQNAMDNLSINLGCYTDGHNTIKIDKSHIYTDDQKFVYNLDMAKIGKRIDFSAKYINDNGVLKFVESDIYSYQLDRRRGLDYITIYERGRAHVFHNTAC